MTALVNHRPLVPSVNGKERLQAITKATTDELRKELADALSLTAEHLNYLGAVWGELTRRGEDLSELKAGMGFYLSKIAAGELLAEAVVKYAGEPGVLRRLGAVSLDQQRAAIATGKFPWVQNRLGPPRRVEPATHREVVARTRDDVSMAAVAGPKDVAETIVAMVRAAKGPRDVAARVLLEIEPIANGKQKRFA